MNRYTSYETDDFVQDDFFCLWVLNPDAEAQLFWQNWLAEHPEQQDDVLKARVIVQQMRDASSNEVADELLTESWDIIAEATKPRTVSISSYALRSIAAVITLLIVTTIGYQISLSSDESTYTTPSAVEWMVLENNTSAVQRLELADGSVITLEPKSLLRYPSFFEGKNRSVVLEGEAFFDIAQDTTLPFIVYANETVIRVLGTSFFVYADEAEDDVEVVVKTGKVAVYKRKELSTDNRSKYNSKATPLLVTPNQKVVFEKATQQLTKRLTSTPSLVIPLASLPKRKFEDTPVNEIFSALEAAYGVSIIWDTREEINHCLLTTTLTEQSLFEKLDIICTPLGLQYHEQDARIIISGSCKN